MSDVLELIGRTRELFEEDILRLDKEICRIVETSRFLVLGGAGSIGQAVVKEIFKRNPAKLDVVDISENNLVELVRDLRSSIGYTDGVFRTFALDIGTTEYDSFFHAEGDYDYILNLSALKHVRSEKDPFTLMRMINVNVFNTLKTLKQAAAIGAKKYFCVSTDKAANPVNMMGASKRIMEMYVMRESQHIDVSMARFANVAFSDGSLLHGFNQRIEKKQPIVAPNDIKRYFVTPKESGELCLLSCLFGENGDILFPQLSDALHLITFSDIAKRYLAARGYGTHLCSSEDEARDAIISCLDRGTWPCLFTGSDTTGEKGYEEFFTENETLDMERFSCLGVIKNDRRYNAVKLDYFSESVSALLARGEWKKTELVELFHEMIPGFHHLETGKYLDGKM